MINKHDNSTAFYNIYRLLKQIQTANICLNVERDCNSVIMSAKVGPPGEKSWKRTCTHVPFYNSAVYIVVVCMYMYIDYVHLM